MYSQESALAIRWRQYKVCSDRLALVPLNFMWFFFWVFLHYLSSNDCTLAYYQYINIIKYAFFLLLANIYVKTNILICLTKLWTYIPGFSYLMSGPNIRPQSCAIASCWTKEHKRVCLCGVLGFITFLNGLQEWRDYRDWDVTNCQVFQMGEFIYILEDFCIFPSLFIFFKWVCHIEMLPPFWLV